MASTYFENLVFYRDLVSLSMSEPGQTEEQSQLANNSSDTTICARIRPLSGEEEEALHISGVVTKESSKAVLFEPRKRFDGTPDTNVSLSYVLLE